MRSSAIGKFLFPSLNKKFLIRIVLVALSCFLIFGYLLIPLRIQGSSMEPTYPDKSFAFCWRLQYLFTTPERFDVVAVRFSGRNVMLLKRIVALPGETVEFREGMLVVNGRAIDEPYVVYRSDWETSARKIAPDHVYIVGDNRGTSADAHKFGEVSINRIIGRVFP